MRAFRSVGGTPPFHRARQGSRIYDADGNEYIDYVGSWGPLLWAIVSTRDSTRCARR